MKFLIKNSKGFCQVSLLLFISLFVILYLTFGFSLALTQIRTQARSYCIEESTQLQSSVLKKMRTLFELNKISTTLRISKIATLAAIAAATAAQQYYLLPPLQKTLDLIKTSQKALDATQKALIFAAQAELRLQHAKILLNLNKNTQNQSSPWKKMLSLFSVTYSNTYPKLAIQPDRKNDLAPNYEWIPQADKIQAVSYSWMLFMNTKSEFQTLLKWATQINFTCSVLPKVSNSKGEKWSLKITEDKPSLR